MSSERSNDTKSIRDAIRQASDNSAKAPQFSESLGGASVAKITAALLYVIGACFALVQSIPILMNANAAADAVARQAG